MIQFAKRLLFVVLFLGTGTGCLHTPLPGATRGVVLLENMDYMNLDSANAPVGILTGVAIDEHTILTAAHLFRYDPEPGHPLKVNGQRVEYTILSDGWHGVRDLSTKIRSNVYDETVHTDILLLSVDEPVVEFAEYAEFGIENYDRLSAITLLTNEIESGQPVAIPLRRLGFNGIEGAVYASLSQRQQDKFYLSGSPVVGAYSDGSMVLLGLVSADGDVSASFAGIKINQEPVVWITPIDFLEARRSASQAESN
ncbi:MAG: hypothetical protein JKX70_07970 [Phycisphaerales bacterium]|nr:hypothetical protein [Phycisphaerales bacterium]